MPANLVTTPTPEIAGAERTQPHSLKDEKISLRQFLGKVSKIGALSVAGAITVSTAGEIASSRNREVARLRKSSGVKAGSTSATASAAPAGDAVPIPQQSLSEIAFRSLARTEISINAQKGLGKLDLPVSFNNASSSYEKVLTRWERSEFEDLLKNDFVNSVIRLVKRTVVVGPAIEEALCRGFPGSLVNDAKMHWKIGIGAAGFFALAHNYETRESGEDPSSFSLRHVPVFSFISGLQYWWHHRTTGLSAAWLSHALHNARCTAPVVMEMRDMRRTLQAGGEIDWSSPSVKQIAGMILECCGKR